MDEEELRRLEVDALIVQGDTEGSVAYYQPCRTSLDTAKGRLSFDADSGNLRHSLGFYREPLAAFDAEESTITIWPLVTTPSVRFMQPKYMRIRSIVIETERLKIPVTSEDAEDVLLGLPDGFIRDWRWGLGLHKLYHPILQAVSQIRRPLEVGTPIGNRRHEELRYSSTQPSGISKRGYVINERDYNRLRFALSRIQSKHRKDALAERTSLTYNALLSSVEPAAYPPRHPRYKPDTIFKVITDGEPHKRLSKDDRAALLTELGRRAPEIAEKDPGQLGALRHTIELVSLETLIAKFENLLGKSTSESHWQELLKLNPFILSMVFGYPVVLVREQAAVGGMGFDRSRERIADFLLKNEATNSAALVEIKTPNTVLIGKSEYAGVPNIAPSLTSAVLQILDQRVGLLTHLQSKKADSQVELEGWFVSCVVIAGRTPDSTNQRKALELYRNSLKDVSVLTFDELLARLKNLRDYLKERPIAIREPATRTDSDDIPF